MKYSLIKTIFYTQNRGCLIDVLINGTAVWYFQNMRNMKGVAAGKEQILNDDNELFVKGNK